MDSQPSLEQVSLNSSLAGIKVPPVDGEDPSPASSASGIDRVLATALADSTEKWLVTKGKMDYGPFSLADVIKQIEKGDIVHGNVIMDKDTGARADVASHPLLGPMVDQAKQKRDDQRRAQAEVAVASSHKTKGAVLYGFITLGVVGAALAAFMIIKAASNDETKKVAGIEELDGASLKVSVSMPKVPPKKPKRTGGGGGGTNGGGAGSYTKGSEDMSLDMSDENDDGGSRTLDMNVVYGVYSKYGGKLGGCLARNGGGSASISIIIDGKSGRVTFVKVDGGQSGGKWSCFNGVMRSMQFPTTGGGRTRAEFDIGV